MMEKVWGWYTGYLKNYSIRGGLLMLSGKGRLTLVSKCLSEIASTEGTICMVSMMCEREQQIGGGQIKDIRRRE
jgi:hypothetical protein